MPAAVRSPGAHARPVESPFAPRSIAALAAFLLLSYGAASLGGVATSAGMGAWYDALAKPAWTPPGALIGAVWTILFGLIGVSAWLVWRAGGLARHPVAFGLFGAQLALNILWSVLFFALRSPGAAFREIVLLEAAILATVVAFWRVRPLAGVLLVPYAAWVAFAAALNFVIWRLNA